MLIYPFASESYRGVLVLGIVTFFISNQYRNEAMPTRKRRRAFSANNGLVVCHLI